MSKKKLGKYDLYLIYDKPIPIKDLLLYPIKLEEYIEFWFLVGCLLFDKNSIPDAKIISMTYLEYLIHLYSNGDKNPLYMLDALLRMVLHKPDASISWGLDDKTNRGVFVIDEISYNSDDFEEIKNAICLQNSVELPDESIQKEIRDRMEEGRKLKNRLSKNKPASFEDQMVCLATSTGLKMEDIYNLTIRKFTKMLRRIDAKLHYEIFLSASMSGMVEFKDKSIIKHWLTELDDEDDNSDVTVGMDALRGKVSLEDKKK